MNIADSGTPIVQEQEERIKELESMNNNLIRIHKERSNSERKLTPKKQHSGYVVQYMQEYVYRYSAIRPDPGFEGLPEEWLNAYGHARNEQKTVRVWKSQLITPYSADLSFEEARDYVERDIREGSILDELGIKEVSAKDQLGEYQEFKDAQGSEVCGCFQCLLKANYNTGYWELEMYTTSHLAVGPNYRRCN